MSDVKAPVTKPAQAESIVGVEDNLTPILLFLAAITVFTFGYVCYYAEKTNERLLRLEKIIGMDEIGRRK
jgi:hypothetical protein